MPARRLQIRAGCFPHIPAQSDQTLLSHPKEFSLTDLIGVKGQQAHIPQHGSTIDIKQASLEFDTRKIDDRNYIRHALRRDPSGFSKTSRMPNAASQPHPHPCYAQTGPDSMQVNAPEFMSSFASDCEVLTSATRARSATGVCSGGFSKGPVILKADRFRLHVLLPVQQ